MPENISKNTNQTEEETTADNTLGKENAPLIENTEFSQDALETAGEAIAVKPRSFLKELYEYVETFCYALVLMILLFMFLFRYVSVDGESMRDTLQDKDKLVISNLAYTPQTGDIVVLKHSPEPLIKRIIATEGQTVKIDYANWKIYVDGVLLNESYVLRTSGGMTNYSDKDVEEFTVEKGKVFVMGDNRNNSMDSRTFGNNYFTEEDILGRVIFRIFPLSKFGDVDK